MSKKQKIIGAACGAAVFLISFICWIFNAPQKRYVFLFESFDSGKICMEERYVPKEKGKTKIQLFSDEILLGPQNPRYRPLFQIETSTLFCFFSDKTLFINFSSDIIRNGSGSSDMNKGFELYRKNVLHNFNNIKNIKMFAGGHELI